MTTLSPVVSAAASLEPCDLALYTDAYKQRASRADAFEYNLDTWDRFATTKPLLYLPERTPNGDFDTRDHKRRLWTHTELDAFGDVIEQRTCALLDAQEQLLRSWFAAATNVERIVRGFLARRRVQKIRDAIAATEAELKRARLAMQRLQQQIVAALLVQRAYRRHVAHLAHIETCHKRLQRIVRLFLFRRRWLHASCTIQRAFRIHRVRYSVYAHLHALCKLLRTERQQQQLSQLALVFAHSREQAHHAQQQQLWERYPDKMALLQRAQHQRNALLSSTLPPLRSSADARTSTAPKRFPKATTRQVATRSTSSGSNKPSKQSRSSNQAPVPLPPLQRHY